MSTKGHGPQSLANEGAKISGTPTQSVDSQGRLGGNATCDHSQRLLPGPLECTVTGDTTLSKPFTAVQPTRGATPCPRDRLQRPFDEGPRNKPRLVELLGPLPSRYRRPAYRLQLPDPPSRTLVSWKDLYPQNPRVTHPESPRGKRKSCLIKHKRNKRILI